MSFTVHTNTRKFSGQKHSQFKRFTGKSVKLTDQIS